MRAQAASAPASASPPKKLFEFVAKAGGAGFVAADKHIEGEDEFLTPNGGKVALTGIELALVVKGKVGQEATVTLSPTIEGPDGMVRLGLDPPTVLLAGTGFGIEFPGEGIVIDDTEEAAPPERARVDGVEIATPADMPAWRCIAVSTLRFHLPKELPFFGKHPVSAYLEVGKDPTPGIDLIVKTKLPPKDGQPWDRGAHRMPRSSRDRPFVLCPDARGSGNGAAARRPSGELLPRRRQPEHHLRGRKAGHRPRPVRPRAKGGRPGYDPHSRH
jgi:hypothetical protein